MDYDKTSIAGTYRQARDHGPAFLSLWMQVVAEKAGLRAPKSILDLGCGAGRFSESLAEHFGANVIGIDPSLTMLAQALEHTRDPRVCYASGRGESIPAPSGMVDLVFISMVFHHFVEPLAAAQECYRVLQPQGRVLLRTASTDRAASYPYVPFMPATMTFQKEVFESAGFRTVFAGLVTQEIAPDYPAYAEKLAARADSILVRLNESDFQKGLEAIRTCIKPGPITEPIDVVVFEK